MIRKPNIPEEIGWGKQYSSRGSLKAGAGWMMLAFLTDLPGMYLLGNHQDWPGALRLAIALLPLMAMLLYVRSIARWVRGMDELHRRIALESFLFATVAYLCLAATWFLLNQARVWDVVFQTTGLRLERMPFWNCTLIICLTYVFFGAGYSILKRRYQ